MGGVNNTDLRKRGFFAYVISTRGLTEGARAIRPPDRRAKLLRVNFEGSVVRWDSEKAVGLSGGDRHVGAAGP